MACQRTSLIMNGVVGSPRSRSTTPGLRRIPAAQRRIIALSAYPTKHARIGNAVGLDTSVSVIKLLRAMREAGTTWVRRATDPGPACSIRSRASIPTPLRATR